jgi:citrate-Mg2+:H+ or citrate-Ca2+:H+ symporter, CitMHS family
MLALIGILTIATLLFCIMSKRLSPIVSLIIIPILGAIVALYVVPIIQGSVEALPIYSTIPKMAVSGIAKLAPMAAMFVFAIIFFGVVSDAGMFDPIIAKILQIVGTSPKKIIIGTGVLALIAHLDGNGAVTFLITVPAMIPLYDKLGIDKRILAGITALSAGVNFLPWTGPMIRAASAVEVSTHDLFTPLIPAQISGLAFMVFMGWYWGRKEEKRLGLVGGRAGGTITDGEGAETITHFKPKELTEEELKLRRPHLFWPNIILVLVVITCMVATKIAPTIIFMVACCIALTLNYRKPAEQSARINAHAKGALMMATILFAAGVFTGIMSESGMLKAMAVATGEFVPNGLASHIPFIVSLIAMPLSLIFDPDSYYFGIMPVVANIGGFPPIQVAQASLLGQMTTGFPVSPLTPATFLLCSLSGVDLADHQKFSIPVLWAASIVMAISAVLTGVFPL